MKVNINEDDVIGLDFELEMRNEMISFFWYFAKLNAFVCKLCDFFCLKTPFKCRTDRDRSLILRSAVGEVVENIMFLV